MFRPVIIGLSDVAATQRRQPANSLRKADRVAGTAGAFLRSMLQTTVLESTADLLACRPDIGALLREDNITDDLSRLAPPRRPGLWAIGHLLTYAGGQPCGLVALYAVAQSPQTLVLGPMAGRLVVGKRRTLAALGVMRHLARHRGDWSELLIAGGGPESRRFDTAARSGRHARRLLSPRGTVEPLLAICSQATWRSRWRFRSAGDGALASHWRTDAWLPTLEDDIAYSIAQADRRAAAETIMMRPPQIPMGPLVASAAEPRADFEPATDPDASRSRRLPPHLRVVSPDDE